MAWSLHRASPPKPRTAPARVLEPGLDALLRQTLSVRVQLVGDDDGGAVAQRRGWRDAILLLRPFAPSVSRRIERAEFG